MNSLYSLFHVAGLCCCCCCAGFFDQIKEEEEEPYFLNETAVFLIFFVPVYPTYRSCFKDKIRHQGQEVDSPLN
jgi:hypothetical protein